MVPPSLTEFNHKRPKHPFFSDSKRKACLRRGSDRTNPEKLGSTVDLKRLKGQAAESAKVDRLHEAQGGLGAEESGYSWLNTHSVHEVKEFTDCE